MMSSGIYATWYELEEESKSEFLDWMHNSYIPQELTRPGYLWAAHYELGYVGEAEQKVVDTLIYDKGSGLGRGRGFLILFGGLSAYTFFDPNPNQKEEKQDENTSKMLGMRKEVYTCTFSEEYRVDGLDVKQRGPGITSAPAIQMGNFNIDSYTNETEVGSWYAQYRLPFMTEIPGCIGARKLLASSGWGKHSILYEFTSLEAREDYFVPHEANSNDEKVWTSKILPTLIHAPCSPNVGKRIWPKK